MSSLFCRHNRFTAECPICSKGTVLDPGKAGRRAAPRPSAPRRRAGGRRPGPPPGAARVSVGPYAAAGPYERGDGGRYEVRLERVPGGVRLGSWAGGALQREAPVLRADDLPAMVREAVERELVPEREREALAAALRPPGEQRPDAGASGPPGDPPRAGAASAGGGTAPGAAAPGGQPLGAGGAEAGAPAPGEPPYGVSPGRSGDLPEELRVEPLGEPGLLRVARWLYRPGPAEWELQEAPPMLPAARLAEALASGVRRGVLRTTQA